MLGCDDSPNIQRTNGVHPSAYVALSSLDSLLRQPADPKLFSGGYGRRSGGLVFHLPPWCCRLGRDFLKSLLTRNLTCYGSVYVSFLDVEAFSDMSSRWVFRLRLR